MGDDIFRTRDASDEQSRIIQVSHEEWKVRPHTDRRIDMDKLHGHPQERERERVSEREREKESEDRYERSCGVGALQLRWLFLSVPARAHGIGWLLSRSTLIISLL